MKTFASFFWGFLAALCLFLNQRIENNWVSLLLILVAFGFLFLAIKNSKIVGRFKDKR